MSISDSFHGSALNGDAGGMKGEGVKKPIYRVILEGVKSEFETIDSFAIKYSILVNTPVTRIKFLLRSLPTTILETRSAARAHSALELIEEAGGNGRVEEFDLEAAPKIEISEQEPQTAVPGENTCPKCGFPLKEQEEFCQFCHTPLVENTSHRVKTILKAGGGGTLVEPKRLAIYLIILFLAIIWDLLVM
jgi:hypothetical protein